MKTENKIELFDKELFFYNDELFKAAKLAISMGYKVHTFKPSGIYIHQIFVDNGKTFGSISEYFSGVRHSTCHKGDFGSNQGSGFGFGDDPLLVDKDIVNECLMYAPKWANNERGFKKETWTEYLKRCTILKYEEIKF